MTLQEFIHFDQYVRCFTFGKTDIVPVRLRSAPAPVSRRSRLSVAGARRADRERRATLNNALGYEMNTIEFAVQDGVPYAIDFLNPAPDFERDRITPHYFDMVVERMADLVIDRALNGRAQQTWPRWAEMAGPRGAARSRLVGATRSCLMRDSTRIADRTRGTPCSCRERGCRRRASASALAERDARSGGCASAIAALPVPAPVLPATPRRSAGRRARRRRCGALGERVAAAAMERAALFDELGLSEAEIRLVAIDPGYATASTAARADAFILPDSLQFAEYNAESPAGAGYSQRLAELFDGRPLMAPFRERFERGTTARSRACSTRWWPATATGAARASPPLIAIVDWREVPTCSEFELLRDAFAALGVPTVICDPRDLVFDGSRR